MKLKMGPFAEFGIIDAYDENKDYQKYEPEKYNCVRVPDDLINGWWEYLLGMKVIPFGCPAVYTVALNRWGVTIIPPESLPFFVEIVVAKSSLRYKNKKHNEVLSVLLNSLIELLNKAVSENKYVIHFGI